MTDAPPTYWDYLGLDRLLNLQNGFENDESQLAPDELHFITVHQTFELWFKLVLRELRLARDHLGAAHVPEEEVPFVVHHLRRVNTILELAASQFKVMETLTPQDFLDFRDKLLPSSGFQSFQMRELEILLGLDAKERIATGLGDPLAIFRTAGAMTTPAGRMGKERIEAVLTETSLKTAMHGWLVRTPIQGSAPGSPGDDDAVQRFVNAYLAAVERHGEQLVERFASTGAVPKPRAQQQNNEALRGAKDFLHATDIAEEDRGEHIRLRAALLFIESYRELPLLAWPRVLIDAVVELEENLVLWRTRHVRMVERVIGRRTGTGGSSGVDYLERTTHYRIFKELWTVRSLLLPRAALPALENVEVYGFAR